jgi:hypothetical protein
MVSYIFSSTKLENKRAEQDLPRSEEVGRGQGVGGQAEEVAQTMYTHKNKLKTIKKEKKKLLQFNKIFLQIARKIRVYLQKQY